MVIHCHREHAFCSRLSNYVLIKNRADFSRRWKFLEFGLVLRFLKLFTDNVVTELDTLIADIHRRTGN